MPTRPIQPRRRLRACFAVLAVTTLAAAFLAGTLAAPRLDGAGSPAGFWLRLAYAPLCHQLPERSISVGHGVQAVCARCSGLYIGGTLGLLAGALFLAGTGRRPRTWWFVAAAAPTLFDALLPWVGLTGLPNLPRLFLAWPVGLIAGLFLAVGIGEIVAGSRSASQSTYNVPAPPGALEEADV